MTPLFSIAPIFTKKNKLKYNMIVFLLGGHKANFIDPRRLKKTSF